MKSIKRGDIEIVQLLICCGNINFFVTERVYIPTTADEFEYSQVEVLQDEDEYYFINVKYLCIIYKKYPFTKKIKRICNQIPPDLYFSFNNSYIRQ